MALRTRSACWPCLILPLLVACGDADAGDPDGSGDTSGSGASTTSGAGTGAGTSGVTSTTAGSGATGSGSSGTGADPAAWQAVTDRVEAARAAAGVTDLGLVVFDAADQRVYDHQWGAFTADTRVAVASASKMVAGMVLFDVVREGLLTLDSTTGEVLGWTGPHASVTLRHLLSFTSGLPSGDPCTFNAQITLAECVDAIAQKAPEAAPGAQFDYGSVHLAVAGRMAEVVTGKTWNDLFSERLRVPLGLPADVKYFTSPRAEMGTDNPLIAGGLRTSTNEYASLLSLVFHEGSASGVTVGTPALFDAQQIEPFPDAEIVNSPQEKAGYPDVHYGLTAWLECDTPETGCDVISSPGAFGWTPWVDRTNGYYAILAMELDSTPEGGGVVKFSVDLQQSLKPLIAAALASN